MEGYICIWAEKKLLWIDETLLDIDEGLYEHTWVCYLYNVLYTIVIIISVDVHVGICTVLDDRHDLIRQPSIVQQGCCGGFWVQRGAGSQFACQC